MSSQSVIIPGMAVQDKNELSDRELGILRLVATGVSNKEIAQKLNISPNTVKVHLRNIFSKIGVVSRTEAAMYAVRIGLVPSGQAILDQRSDLSTSNQSENLPIRSTVSVSDSPLFLGWLRQRPFLLIIALFFLVGLAVVFASLLRQPDKNPSITDIPLNTSTLAVESRWKQLAPLPTARTGLASVLFENQIYALGGETTQVSGSVDVYDVSNDSWQKRSSLPIPVTDLQAAVIGGLIYVPGGKTSSGIPTDQLQIYDPVEDQWFSGTPMPRKISAYSLATFEGRIFLFGGWDGNNFLNTAFGYNPANNEWEELGVMPTARAYMGATLIGNKIYLLGGYDGEKFYDTVDSLILSSAFTGKLEWESLLAMPGARSGLTAVSLADIGFIIGGNPDEKGENYAVGWQFLPQSMEWGSFEDLPVKSWSRMAAVGQGAYIHILGGEVDGKITAQHLAYQAINVMFLPLIK